MLQIETALSQIDTILLQIETALPKNNMSENGSQFAAGRSRFSVVSIFGRAVSIFGRSENNKSGAKRSARAYSLLGPRGTVNAVSKEEFSEVASSQTL